tara:strand:- start:109 stop:819 length:711 start_codon:yes stop_codon:yes gene_type:complete
MDNIYQVEEVVAELFSRLDITDTRDEAVFYNWVYSAVRELGSNSLDITSECVEITDLCIAKPCDYGGLVDLALLKGSRSMPFVFTNTGSSSDRGDFEDIGESNLGSIYVSEDDTRFNLSSNAKLDYAEITYYALPINKEGLPIIREIVKEAVISFCEYQWVKRERRRSPKLIGMNDVDYYNREWKLAKGTAKGRQKMVNPVQAETILRNWMTLLPKFKTKNRHRRESRGLNNKNVY